MSPNSVRRKLLQMTANLDWPLRLSKAYHAKSRFSDCLQASDLFADDDHDDEDDSGVGESDNSRDGSGGNDITSMDEIDATSACTREYDSGKYTYQITGDNLDFTIKRKYVTIGRADKTLHWFNLVATVERYTVTGHLASGSSTAAKIEDLFSIFAAVDELTATKSQLAAAQKQIDDLRKKNRALRAESAKGWSGRVSENMNFFLSCTDYLKRRLETT